MDIGIKECSKCENNLRCKECTLPQLNESLKAEVKELRYLLDDKRKHGEWIKRKEIFFETEGEVDAVGCSICGKSQRLYRKTKFCPECGAKMDLKAGDA